MALEPGAEERLRDRARKLQTLHIGLLFCRRTLARWTAEPGAVLAEMGLAPEDAGLIVDTTSAQFAAEAHGRRVAVERGIGKFFERTQRLLAERESAAAEGNDPGFDDFLCSPYFLDPRRGLPHGSGIGPGYENVSKYFFWLRHAFGLDRPGADQALRTAAYSEFAAWLVNEYKRPHDPFYDQFKGGLYWARIPGETLPVMLLTEDFMMATIGSAKTAADIARIGLVNLDDLVPPAWPEQPMSA